ncbi:copper-containing nitrite reductase [Natronolimnobius baerhuensis]|uniref:Copper-containing nitrite reductase n=1 Tax=Natronolimnobius baerhuensis TaxID=253108 RepID=A0A202E7N0_9EURY|nr:copper-containing nitrite reductase [Natronolimnobius baerhuensis]OVE84263.1 nitrite reductase, copper-containing [Natronolimnobius baerhuensis]
MTHSATIDRRRMLQVLGATGAAAIAGCIATENTAPDEGNGSSADEIDDGLPAAESVDVDSVLADPTDIPAPVDWDEPREHDITIECTEHIAEIEPGVTFHFMTFEGQVPGPMVRVREGDTVNLTFRVPEESNMYAHNIDFHAVYGPGGGAEHTTLRPGDEEATISARMDYAGSHIYHCAVPNMDHHISAGMFGAILVEPKDGLPEVDRELYLGQHELYTDGDTGEEGHHSYDFDAGAAEDPTYVLFNGEAYGLTEDGTHGPMHAEVGETVRLHFANGGPNLLSSVHPIGNVFSRLYRDGDLLSDPARNVETTPVAPGTVTMAEMEMKVPGPVKIVDHALSRAGRKGALAVIDVDGEANPDIYNPDA